MNECYRLPLCDFVHGKVQYQLGLGEISFVLTSQSNLVRSPALVVQGVSARLTGYILEALLLQGELED